MTRADRIALARWDAAIATFRVGVPPFGQALEFQVAVATAGVLGERTVHTLHQLQALGAADLARTATAGSTSKTRPGSPPTTPPC